MNTHFGFHLILFWLNSFTKSDDLYVNDEPPKMLPLRPIIRGPYSENADDDEHSTETTIVYTEQHTEVKLNCEVDLDIAAVVWMHNGQVSADFHCCHFLFLFVFSSSALLLPTMP